MYACKSFLLIYFFSLEGDNNDRFVSNSDYHNVTFIWKGLGKEHQVRQISVRNCYSKNVSKKQDSINEPACSILELS